MNNKLVVKLALSTAFVAGATLASTTAGVTGTTKVSVKKAGPEKAYGWAKKAEAALAKGKVDRALTFAELAVEAEMQNRDYRALLARVYMTQGRFVSAERTLMDVMELGQVDPRTVISLALSRIAQGKIESAVGVVEANRAILPASDYGLTLALAGQSAQAVEVLTEAIRAENANARTRQNLALALALDGKWRDARIVAQQDMTQDRVSDRIAEWAQYARPDAYQLRVAGMLKVMPRMDDAGQPVRLALAPVAAPALAEVMPEAAPVVPAAPEQSVELAAVGPAPVASSAGFAAVAEDVKIAEVAIPASEIVAVETPLIAAAKTPAKVEAAPVKLAMADVPATKPAAIAPGTHLVQLGAFSNAANAKAAWAKYSKRYGALQGFESASSTVTVNGRTLVRLAASGFSNQASAVSTCRQIKAQGGVCLVRSTGEKPVRMASQTGRRVASR